MYAINGAEMSTTSSNAPDPIAIIGIGCRLPGGVTNPDEFWALLRNEVDAISEIPEDRWNIQKFFDPDQSKPGHTYVKWGGFVDGIDQFDAQFFGISPREAAAMDPQQRMLLETTWEALEDGGQVPEQLAGSQTGVFVGIFMRDYEQLHTSHYNRPLINNHTGVGTSMSIAANRISYTFDFMGPSVALDTACSSSLIAVHLACQSLRNGECTMAVAGGASLLLKPEQTIATSKAAMLSPDGRCKSFDARANGYVRSEGCGVVVLKPLSAAQADGDPIYAVIRGSATNQDGRSKGLTVPNGDAQEAALRASLQQAGVAPEQIQYVEAHGTGTFVGDPIETNALGRVIGKERQTPCIIGSVKSNIGHLEATAGVAGLIKATLALKHCQIPANLHFETPNPQIPFAELNLRVPTTLTEWPEPETGTRFVSVNSFGFGGANANVILAEAPSQPIDKLSNQPTNQPLLFPLSARTPEALTAVIAAHRNFVAQTSHSFADLCTTAAMHRGQHPFRATFVAASTTELAEKLRAYLEEEPSTTIATGEVADDSVQLAFVYAGMGTQWWAMGRELLAESSVFLNAVQQIDQLFQPLAGWSVLDALQQDEADSQIHETRVAQPAIFAVQVGLTALWRSWGVEPTTIVGHSVGEIAAAYAAGALTLADAVQVIYHRSRLQQTTAGQGMMLAVGLSESEVVPYLADYQADVAIGAINSPTSVTLAGDEIALRAIAAALEIQKVFNRFLKVEVPYHSPLMDPIRDELVESLQTLAPRAATIPLYSTVTGDLIDGTTLTAEYWWRNVRQPVRFAAAIEKMHEGKMHEGQAGTGGATHFLEVSPHPVLVRSIQETLRHNTGHAVDVNQVISSLRREQSERVMLLHALGQLYTQGYPVAWSQLVQGQFVRLPSYPWQRERYWLESEESFQDRLGGGSQQTTIKQQASNHPLLGGQLNLAPSVQVWEGELERANLAYLDDHRVQRTIIYPGAGYVEMALAVAAQSNGRVAANESVQQLNKITFRKALPLPAAVSGEDDAPVAPRFQVILAGETIDIYSQAPQIDTNDAPAWVHHATGTCATAVEPSAATTPASLGLADLQTRLGTTVDQATCYQQYEALGLRYGPTFQGIEMLWPGEGEAFTRLQIKPEIAEQQDAYQLHPVLIDLCLQSFLGIMIGGDEADDKADDEADDNRNVFLPVQIERMTMWQRPNLQTQLYCHAYLTEENDQQLVGNILLYDESGQPLIEFHGLLCQAVTMPTESANTADQNVLYAVEWQRVSEPTNQPTDQPTNWLIFADGQGIAQTLADRLRTADQRPILVMPGAQYERIDGEHFRIRPDNSMDMAALFTALTGQQLQGVVHLWSLDLADESNVTEQQLHCISTLHLLQNLRHPASRLWLVTQGARAVQAQDVTQPTQIQQAMLWGMGRVIGQEHPDLHCVCLDLDPTSDSTVAAQQLFQEMGAPADDVKQLEDQVAWRNGERYAARLKAVPLDEPFTLSLQQRVKADATYLITGGLGALGLQVAHSLIDQGARYLVLSGRRGAAGKEDAIEALEARGAQVIAAQADVSVAADVTQMLAQIADTCPPLQGVIHAAGVLDDGVLRQQTAERFTKVLAPKVQGAWHLHEQTRDLDLTFFVCFSSVASLLGSPGQGNYAAGNAFMDALVHYRRVLGLPGQSINWGPWAEAGMAADDMILGRLANLGIGAIAGHEGLHIFQALLHANGERTPQVGVVPIDWVKLYQNFPGAKAPFFGQLTQDLVIEQDSLVDELRDLTPEERRTRLTNFLRDQLAQVLGFANAEKINLRQRLFDLGLDSLMAVELKNRLEAGLELAIAPTLMFDYPTVEALVNYLSEEMARKFMAGSEEDQDTGDDQTSPTEEILDDETAELLAELDELSDEELAALLSEELA